MLVNQFYLMGSFKKMMKYLKWNFKVLFGGKNGFFFKGDFLRANRLAKRRPFKHKYKPNPFISQPITHGTPIPIKPKGIRSFSLITPANSQRRDVLWRGSLRFLNCPSVDSVCSGPTCVPSVLSQALTHTHTEERERWSAASSFHLPGNLTVIFLFLRIILFSSYYDLLRICLFLNKT